MQGCKHSGENRNQEGQGQLASQSVNMYVVDLLRNITIIGALRDGHLYNIFVLFC